jgi:hypothetical protein
MLSGGASETREGVKAQGTLNKVILNEVVIKARRTPNVQNR